MNIKEINFSVINLGCVKNLVDTEFVLGEILTQNDQKNDYIFYGDPQDENVEYIIINTCGFLSSSREEAEYNLKYFDDLGKKIIVTGCYVQVKDNEFLLNLKNLVGVVPFENAGHIKDLLSNKKNNLITNLSKFKKEKIKNYLENINEENSNKQAHIFGTDTIRAYIYADKGYEYLKIAEGCNNNCTFCIIPNIRGKQVSRSIEDIIKEVYSMIGLGVKEIEIIAEDTTRYGIDYYGETKLLDLLEEIDKIEKDFKYRLFYMYPDILTLEHLERLSKLKKLIPYFDFPFQHISSPVLKKMGRFYDEKHIRNIIKYIKKNFKTPFLHTNFIVGFPGETEEDFNKLLEFIKEIEFDSISLFGYHDEPLAASSKLKGKLSDKEIQKRVNEFDTVQNKIYEKKKNKRKNKQYIGYIEDIFEDFVYIRPEINAPDIDEVDEVKFEDILKGDIQIGEKVKYLNKGCIYTVYNFDIPE